MPINLTLLIYLITLQAFREGSRKSSRVKVNLQNTLMSTISRIQNAPVKSELWVTFVLFFSGCSSRTGANRAPVSVGEQDQNVDGALRGGQQ